MRMLDLGFAALRDNGVTFYPGRLRDDIDALGGFIRQSVNGGVYKAGFARDQAAFDQAVAEFFAALDVLEDRLADGRPYLLGRSATEVDRSEEHTSELQSLMRISYAVFCLKNKQNRNDRTR